MDDSDEKGLLSYSWLPGLVLAVVLAVFWWIRRRGDPQQSADQPAIWRRDIEMGPASSPETGAPEETRAELIIEAIPEVETGGSGLSEEVETAADVQGPLPGESLPEDSTPAGDDLIIIEGIGPRINQILQSAGIRTFAQLAATEISRLEEILREAGMRRINNPATWPEQARLAAGGDWKGLETLQKQLKAGRK